MTKPKKPEQTSKKVAAIAGRTLKRLEGYDGEILYGIMHGEDPVAMITVADLRALAASALTQAKDKAKP